MQGCGHTLRFEHVSFTYPGAAHEVLSDVNFTLNAGETTVLVGLNGAGKTTLLKLLMRLYDPTGGVIYLDGKDIRTYDLRAYYDLFGIVFQDFGKYALSVRENIAFGDIHRESTPDAICEAAEAANAEAFISRLPDGYETPLTRMFELNGIEPSIGQWQKLAIARAFYSRSDILILDEPTSGLDPVSRDDLLDLLRSLCEQDGVSILFSTHITSDLDACADDVTYLQNGTVAQSVSLAGFTAPWKKLTGPETALAPALRGALRGLRVHRDEFEALYPSDLPCPAGCREELADLQTVMVYLEREVETV